MSYEILGNNGGYWTCRQGSWGFYLDVALAFGWIPKGAIYQHDVSGFFTGPADTYHGNNQQQVGDEDARAFGTALKVAIASAKAGIPMTDGQVRALKFFEIDDDLPDDLENGPAEHPEARTIRARYDLSSVRGLAELVSAGGFTIA
jgi:hypothetical protein